MKTKCNLIRICHICAVIVLSCSVGCVSTPTASRANSSELFYLAGAGDLKRVQALLQSQSDLVFSKDHDGTTALHHAADGGHKNVVELLLAHGADVNALDDNGRTPLHFAAEWGRNDVVALLLASNAQVNTRDNHGDTPYDLALRTDHLVVEDLLRQHGAQKTETAAVSRDAGGEIHDAAPKPDRVTNGDPRIPRASGQKHPLQVSHDLTVFRAAQDGPVEALQSLLAQAPQLLNAQNDEGDTPLHCAVRSENQTTFDFIISQGADPTITNKNNMSAVAIARGLGLTRMLAVLQPLERKQQEEGRKEEESRVLEEKKSSSLMWEGMSDEQIRSSFETCFNLKVELSTQTVWMPQDLFDMIYPFGKAKCIKVLNIHRNRDDQGVINSISMKLRLDWQGPVQNGSAWLELLHYVGGGRPRLKLEKAEGFTKQNVSDALEAFARVYDMGDQLNQVYQALHPK